ncbi:MAG: hypothetical protein OXF08_05995 [Bacteroidetes bacterium]|nr:hypothetical protein [Bacteroidota bacterium]
MRTASPFQPIITLIQEYTVVTFSQMKEVLGPVCDLTVRKKMVLAGCMSSYSHRGRYYTIEECADFDRHGLWSHHDIHFSRHGSLKDTLVELVEQSESGLLSRDLMRMVKVKVHTPLGLLINEKRLYRSKIAERYVYFSKSLSDRRQQLRKRKGGIEYDEEFEHAQRLYLEALNEQHRRLHAGLEVLRPNSGGITEVAKRLNMAPATVRRGRTELQTGEFERKRVRKPGGGRKSTEKKTLKFPNSSIEC